MSDAIKTIEHNGYTIRIVQDTDPFNPREDPAAEIGRMALLHKRYDLPWEIDGLTARQANNECGSWDEVLVAIRNAAKEGGDEVIAVKEVYGYDHGGLTISTQVERGWWHYAWDGGRLGFIIATRKSVKSTLGWERITPQRKAKLLEYLAQEVETYNQYLTGDVYGYVIENPDGEEVDSCFGFFGLEWAEQAARDDCPEPDLEGEPEI